MVFVWWRMSRFSSKYSDEQKDLIRLGWADGSSAATIADLFYKAFKVRVSRNAIIGVANRMGLSPHNASTSASANATAKRLATMAARGTYTGRKPQTPATDVPVPSEEPSPLGLPGESTDGCQWRHGDDPKTWRCCGHPRKPGRPYCEHHYSRAYTTQRIPMNGSSRVDRQFR